MEFLDSLLESTRAKEAAVKQETTEKLEAFHKQREEAEKAILDETDGPGQNLAGVGAGSPVEEEHWVISGRKRKKAKTKEKDGFPGVKLRKASSTSTGVKAHTGERSEDKASPKPGAQGARATGSPQRLTQGSTGSEGIKTTNDDKNQTPATSPKVANAAPLALGLGAYSSDED